MVSAENLGALEIALAFGLMLYGTALTQGYIYYKRSSGDRRFLRILVRTIKSFNLTRLTPHQRLGCYCR